MAPPLPSSAGRWLPHRRRTCSLIYSGMRSICRSFLLQLFGDNLCSRGRQLRRPRESVPRFSPRGSVGIDYFNL